MALRVVNLLSVCAISLCLAQAAFGDVSFGRNLLLSRGLQIQTLGFVSSTPLPPSDFSLWSGAGFTTFNSWNDTNAEKNLGWTMPWARWNGAS